MTVVEIDRPIADNQYEAFTSDYVTPVKIKNALESAGGGDVLIKINSPGGSIFAAVEIRNLINDFGGKVIMQITGNAASAAALIFLSVPVEQRQVYRLSQLMFHRPTGGCWGTAEEMAAYAKSLAEMEVLVGEDLASKTGESLEKSLERLQNNWFLVGGESIVDAGLAGVLLNNDTGEDADEISVEKKETKLFDKSNSKLYNVEGERNMLSKLLNGSKKPKGQGKPVNELNAISLEELREQNPDLLSSIKKQLLAEIELEELTAPAPESQLETIDFEKVLDAAVNERFNSFESKLLSALPEKINEAILLKASGGSIINSNAAEIGNISGDSQHKPATLEMSPDEWAKQLFSQPKEG